jgi:hypothetical protein
MGHETCAGLKYTCCCSVLHLCRAGRGLLHLPADKYCGLLHTSRCHESHCKLPACSLTFEAFCLAASWWFALHLGLYAGHLLCGS